MLSKVKAGPSVPEHLYDFVQVPLGAPQALDDLGVGLVNIYAETCLGALTADLFQGTWITIDQVTQKTTFGPQTQVNDYGACGKFTNPPVARTSPIASPPSINPLLPLLQTLGGA